MKEYPVTFAIQEAPVDPFDPDGPVEYRAVVRCKAQDVSYLVTKRYGSADEALAALSSILFSGSDVMEDINESLASHRHWIFALEDKIKNVKIDASRDLVLHTQDFKHKRY